MSEPEDLANTIYTDLLNWANYGELPDAFSSWKFSEDQLETLKDACCYSTAAEFLALALRDLTREHVVMDLMDAVMSDL